MESNNQLFIKYYEKTADIERNKRFCELIDAGKTLQEVADSAEPAISAERVRMIVKQYKRYIELKNEEI